MLNKHSIYSFGIDINYHYLTASNFSKIWNKLPERKIEHHCFKRKNKHQLFPKCTVVKWQYCRIRNYNTFTVNKANEIFHIFHLSVLGILHVDLSEHDVQFKTYALPPIEDEQFLKNWIQIVFQNN